MPNVQESCREKKRENVSRNGKCIREEVLEHTGAVLLQLRVDRRCLKYQKKRKTNKRKRDSGRLWEWDRK